MDRDEPRFAHATVEMMNRGSWAVPYFNGEYRFDKPPLTYWWMALHYAVFGVHEWSARLHTVIATWLVSLVVMGMGRRWIGARCGLVAGAAWLVTMQVFVHGRLCVADMPMVLAVAVTMGALMELLFDGDELRADERVAWSRWHTCLCVALGLGFLAKGPLAFLIPGLALVLMRFAFWRKGLPWVRLRLLPGLLLALVIVGAWGIPALMETRGLFWKVGMGEHVIDRGARAFNGRFPVPGYYLVTALLSLFPWIALLPQVWASVRAQWDARRAMLFSWLVAPFVIFTLYATQLPHYVMPGFPAAMLLLASVEAWPKKGQWWTWLVLGLWLFVGAVLTCASRMWVWPEGLGDIIASGAKLMLAMALFGLFVVWAVLRRSRGMAVLAALMMIIVPMKLESMCESIRAVNAAVIISADAAALPAKADFVGCNYTEPSLVFHTDRFWKFIGKHSTLDDRLGRSGARLAMVLRREWTLADMAQRVLKHSDLGAPTTDDSAKVDTIVAAHRDYAARTFFVFNAARSSWAEVVVMKRGEGR